MNEKIIIFGNVQGAFHSLVRDLKELKRQNIIDEELKIIDSQYYIIFNGPLICRSAEPLQTLFTLLVLLKQNPDRVIYLENDFQRDGLWKDYGFTQQVYAVYEEYSAEIFKLFEEFTRTLPLAFYGNYAESPEKLLKLTALQEFKYETIENQTGDFFHQLKNGKIHAWPINKREKTSKPVHVRVLVEGLVPALQDLKLKPLMLLEPIEMASVWRVFSSPTIAFQKLFNFDEDAFACIVCGKELPSSIIEIYSRNASSLEPFALKENYRINSGISLKATQENLSMHKQRVVIASMLDLSAKNYVIGNAIRRGISLARRQVNVLDLLPGKEVLAFVYEDFYVPHIARENYELLKAQENIKAFLLSIGSTPLLVSREDLESGATLQVFQASGSSEYRTPEMKGVINFTPSYDLEVESLINFLVKDYRLRSFGFFYQDDDYGRPLLQKAKEVLEKLGIKNYIEIPYAPDTNDFKKQCDMIKNNHIQALGFFSTSFSTQEFLRQLGAYHLASTQLFAVSFVADDVFESLIKNELRLSCIYSRVVPDPRKSPLPIVQEYRSLMDEAGLRYDSFSLLGFICTSILCDMMKKVSDDISYKTLAAQLESLNNYDYKGLTLTFNPQNRQISNRVWLDLQDGNEWQEVLNG